MLNHPEVRYEVTDHCNAHCIMCPRELHDRPHGIMDDVAYVKSINEIVQLGATQVVLTSFGEPLLDRHLERKVAYAHNQGLRTYIITNASALTLTRAIELMKAGLDEIRISFYGMDAVTYNAVMVGLDFDKTMRRVQEMLFHRALLKSPMKVEMSWLELPENKHQTQEFIDFWSSQVDYVEAWRPHNWSNGREYRTLDSEKRTCGRPATGALQIQWDGTVIPCCFDYNNSMPLGNAFETPIMDILRGDKYEALRVAHDKGDWSAHPFCDGCDQLIEHPDALVFSNRHNMTSAEAVKCSNTDLYNLQC